MLFVDSVSSIILCLGQLYSDMFDLPSQADERLQAATKIRPLRQGVQVMEPKKAVTGVAKLMGPNGFPIICCDRFGSSSGF
jgi:hypothetical protein